MDRTARFNPFDQKDYQPMKPSAPDYRLYLVTDRTLARGRAVPEVVSAAVSGGVTCVQAREKTAGAREFLAEVRLTLRVLKGRGVPLVVNDRVDVALAAGADGVHVGQTDLPVTDVRRLVGEKMIVGVSVESVDDAVAAERDGADYVSVSPVYLTPTKTDTAAGLGPEGVAAVRAAVQCPVIAIGGLNRETVGGIVRAGADGAAVVSAVMSAPDPAAAARELREIIDAARGGKAK
ncbi:MAG: thiamine phosphate synthase, partial [Desulfococcaceae bacterium]